MFNPRAQLCVLAVLLPLLFILPTPGFGLVLDLKEEEAPADVMLIKK